jgi:endogenous inhibitor of DNA gyrase (YacG/DUF329 family)
MSDGAKPCPLCGKPREQRFRPFCSARCAEIDLGRWFTEAYAIPGRVTEETTPPEDIPDDMLQP